MRDSANDWHALGRCSFDQKWLGTIGEEGAYPVIFVVSDPVVVQLPYQAFVWDAIERPGKIQDDQVIFVFPV